MVHLVRLEVVTYAFFQFPTNKCRRTSTALLWNPFSGIKQKNSVILRAKEIKSDVIRGHERNVSELKIPALSRHEVLEVMQENAKQTNVKEPYRAMYSSIIGGIITDPMLMTIPIDDHIVHRGHGVFDTAHLIDGYLYELDSHLERLMRSASLAKIPPHFNYSYMRTILIQTAAASECKQGFLKYWLSAGPGNFSLSSSGCKKPAFYAIVFEESLKVCSEGVKVITSTIPMKPTYFAVMKNVNYLPNALSKMEAEEKGAFAGIWIDRNGFVAEGPNMNVAFVNHDNELIMPSFENILAGCTAKRLLELAPRLIDKGLIAGTKLKNITAEEGKKAKEMMLIGSGVLVCPVIMWDEIMIGKGKAGHVAVALLNLLLEDMKSAPSSIHIPVPYET
eukprot:TRINITY_DN6197_c0_g1_i1.p1 TRINITY_DN6197_c0_g1~~TRINITY_DN6197_c0_g1_i1.p1  ORF type:complete len:392 (-),score=70.12 TRINITY_DN6197_c0_g1_i1:36-1211(-)